MPGNLALKPHSHRCCRPEPPRFRTPESAERGSRPRATRTAVLGAGHLAKLEPRQSREIGFYEAVRALLKHFSAAVRPGTIQTYILARLVARAANRLNELAVGEQGRAPGSRFPPLRLRAWRRLHVTHLPSVDGGHARSTEPTPKRSAYARRTSLRCVLRAGVCQRFFEP